MGEVHHLCVLRRPRRILSRVLTLEGEHTIRACYSETLQTKPSFQYNLFCAIVDRIHWLETTFGDDSVDRSTLPTSTDDDEEIIEWLCSEGEGTFDEQWRVFTDMLRSAKDLADYRSFGNDAVRDSED